MHVLTHSFLAVHLATCLALDFLFKLARNLFHKIMDSVMEVLGINALSDLISQTERALKLLAVTSIFLASAGIGVYLGSRRA